MERSDKGWIEVQQYGKNNVLLNTKAYKSCLEDTENKGMVLKWAEYGTFKLI